MTNSERNGRTEAMGRGLRGLAVTALVAAACGCMERESATAPSPSRGVSIQGRVSDFVTGNGIPGAVVQFAAEPSGRATTDSSGGYVVSLPVGTLLSALVNGVQVGTVWVTGPSHRGDLFIDQGTCISRYGTVADARTGVRIAGAVVSVGGGTATSGADGWYRIDLGCPSTGTIGFGTTFLRVTHPNYADHQLVAGRGVQAVRRLDLALERR